MPSGPANRFQGPCESSTPRNKEADARRVGLRKFGGDSESVMQCPTHVQAAGRHTRPIRHAANRSRIPLALDFQVLPVKPAEQRPKRALGYVWNASGQPVELSPIVGDPRRGIAELASARGLQLLDVLDESPRARDQNGEATGAERPVLLDLLEKARCGEFDVLIVGTGIGPSNESVTRAFLERRLQQYGVELEWAAGEEDQEPTVDAARDLLSTVDELERAVRMRHLSAGKAQKKALGRHVHGRLPYGYQSERGVLRPIENLAPIVRHIFADAARGCSPGQIARGLNESRISPPQGGRAWSEQGVRVVLANPAYTGERYGVKDAHPALVDRRLWKAAQQALRSRRRS